jgi:hypothetical protein
MVEQQEVVKTEKKLADFQKKFCKVKSFLCSAAKNSLVQYNIKDRVQTKIINRRKTISTFTSQMSSNPYRFRGRPTDWYRITLAPLSILRGQYL